MILRYDQGMTTHTDPNVETIKDASLDDVRASDHIVWEHTETFHGVARTVRHEGIAHHRDQEGDWCTEEGRWITNGEGEDIILTIRRTIPEPPAEYDGVVLVPADGHKAITTKTGQEFARLTFTTKQDLWYGPNLAARPGDWVIQTTAADRLTLGTWKVEDR